VIGLVPKTDVEAVMKFSDVTPAEPSSPPMLSVDAPVDGDEYVIILMASGADDANAGAQIEKYFW